MSIENEKKKEDVLSKHETFRQELRRKQELREQTKREWKLQNHASKEAEDPLYVKLERKYIMEKQLPDLQERKEMLYKIKMKLKPLSREEIDIHERNYKESLQEKAKERKQERELSSSRTKNYKIPFQEGSKSSGSLHAREDQAKELERKELIQRKNNYSKIVKEAHAPTVSAKKRLEMQLLIENHNLDPKERVRAGQNYDHTSSTPNNHPPYRVRNSQNLLSTPSQASGYGQRSINQDLKELATRSSSQNLTSSTKNSHSHQAFSMVNHVPSEVSLNIQERKSVGLLLPTVQERNITATSFSKSPIGRFKNGSSPKLSYRTRFSEVESVTELNKEKKRQEASKKSTMWLRQSRERRINQADSYSVRLEDGKEEGWWVKDLEDKNLSVADKSMRIKNKVRAIESQLGRKEEMIKINSKDFVSESKEVNSMLIDALKARIALLEKDL